MNSNQPTVSVVIPALNAAEKLPAALASVADQTYDNVVEVIVAAADDDSAKAAESWATVIRNPSGTTPAALNLAIARSRGDVIVRCDAQSVLPPGYVARAIATQARTGAATVGGMQIPVGETPWEKAIAAAMKSPFGAGDARYRIGGDEGPAETVYLGVFRRDVLEKVGGFDESFIRNQDYEFNHRLIDAGETVWFDPELKVEYRPRGTLGALARQYFEYGKAKRQFNRKHPGHLRWRQTTPPLLLITLAATLVGSLWIPWLAAVPLAYCVGLLVIGLATRTRPIRVAASLAAMHFSWAAGFISSAGRSRD